ncbi:hypothetical protein HY480_04665 [Candidatus Uhrbacteria bacterium]|nr:hypothetical protein [Candidatus Uhrbacteria bacterium]
MRMRPEQPTSGNQPNEETSEPSHDNTLIGRIRSGVQSGVQESQLPTRETLGYESTVGTYGGKLTTDPDGKLVYDVRGVTSHIDRWGDAILRTFDEHVLREPLRLLRSHPRWFFRFLVPGAKRCRGTPAEITANAERLGLGDAYGQHTWGVEIKQPAIYRHGRPLQDIYRADLIGNTDLARIDRFQALGDAAAYLRGIHDRANGGVGEVLPSDVIFRDVADDRAVAPILNLPDIVWNPEKHIGVLDQRATDLLDFLASIAVEERRRSPGDDAAVQRALRTILDHYGDRATIAMTRSFAGRGRLTLRGDEDILALPDTVTTSARALTAQHNFARTSIRSDFAGEIRTHLIAACDAFLGRA